MGMFRSELEFGAKYHICCVKPDWEEKQYTGTLVALIERGRKPTREEVIEYYEIDESSKWWKGIMRAVNVSRYVFKLESGFLILPEHVRNSIYKIKLGVGA